jgi:hypothetical protein
MNTIQNLVVLVSINVMLLNCYGMGSSDGTCIVGEIHNHTADDWIFNDTIKIKAGEVANINKKLSFFASERDDGRQIGRKAQVVYFCKENDSLQTVLKIEETQRDDGRVEIQAYLIKEDGSKPQPEYGTVLHSVPADKKITFSYSFEPHLAGRDLKRSWINVIMKSSLGNVYVWDEKIE